MRWTCVIVALLLAAFVAIGCSTGTVRETYEVTPSASKAVSQGSQYRYQRNAVCPFLQQQTVRVEGKLYSYREAPDGTITLTPLEVNP